MEDAQQELGVEPKHFVPVQYTSDSTWAIELMGIFPSLILIGIVFGMMWGLSGAGVKVGGGSGGIFQVGNSKAKKLRKKISMLLSRMLQGGKRPRRGPPGEGGHYTWRGHPSTRK